MRRVPVLPLFLTVATTLAGLAGCADPNPTFVFDSGTTVRDAGDPPLESVPRRWGARPTAWTRTPGADDAGDAR